MRRDFRAEDSKPIVARERFPDDQPSELYNTASPGRKLMADQVVLAVEEIVEVVGVHFGVYADPKKSVDFARSVKNFICDPNKFVKFDYYFIGAKNRARINEFLSDLLKKFPVVRFFKTPHLQDSKQGMKKKAKETISKASAKYVAMINSEEDPVPNNDGTGDEDESGALSIIDACSVVSDDLFSL